jgi:hypothetical protein
VKCRKGRHQNETSFLLELSELAAALKKRFSACDGVLNLQGREWWACFNPRARGGARPGDYPARAAYYP